MYKKCLHGLWYLGTNHELARTGETLDAGSLPNLNIGHVIGGLGLLIANASVLAGPTS